MDFCQRVSNVDRNPDEIQTAKSRICSALFRCSYTFCEFILDCIGCFPSIKQVIGPNRTQKTVEPREQRSSTHFCHGENQDNFFLSDATLANFHPGIEKVSDCLDFAWIDQQLNIHGRVAITVLVGKLSDF